MNESMLMTDHVVHLTDELGICVSPLTDELWTSRDRPELATGRLLSIFSYDSTWDYQERHLTGDELVYVLSGAVDLLVDTGGGERAIHLPAGFVGVVPAGGWHRLAVHEACSVLFITPTPAQTEHRGAPVPSSLPA
jgi:mannose-6-phosphate isomerase-like protein (cupin superfamily)